MKKNIITIIILALSLINVILTAVIVFAVVPTANKTNNIMARISNIIDLELESPDDAYANLSVSDIATHSIADKMQVNLKKTGDQQHYVILSVSLSYNKKHEDTEKYELLIPDQENAIKEIITEEFNNYTLDEVYDNNIKNEIKEKVLTRIQNLFNSDFIINVSFGNMILN